MTESLIIAPPISGVSLIATERVRQLVNLKKTVDHDKRNNFQGQLIEAATGLLKNTLKERIIYKPVGWYSKKWDKLCDKPQRERIIIAGAFLAAELDRTEGDFPTPDIVQLIMDDTIRLDKLQDLTTGLGNGWICGKSKATGFVLTESKANGAVEDIRQAIDNYKQ